MTPENDETQNENVANSPEENNRLRSLIDDISSGEPQQNSSQTAGNENDSEKSGNIRYKVWVYENGKLVLSRK